MTGATERWEKERVAELICRARVGNGCWAEGRDRWTGTLSGLLGAQ